MNLNDNALSILVALQNEPATRETISEILDWKELQLRPIMGKLVNGKLIAALPKRCPISNNVLFDLTEEGRKIIGEREEAKPVAQPKKPVKKASVAKVEDPAPAQPPEGTPVPDADPALLASANRMLSDRLHGAALALREFGIPSLERANGNEEIQGFIRLAAASWRDQRDEINRLEAHHRSLQARIHAELDAHKSVANAACSDLAAISRSLFLDPDMGGAKPILAAIENIVTQRQKAESQRDAWRDAVGTISGEDTPENASRHFAEINSELSRLRAENVALKTLKKDMPGFGAAHEKIKQATPRRPFSVTGLSGYHANAGKVTLFLDRRLNARSVTLTVDKLEKLAAMAVSYP